MSIRFDRLMNVVRALEEAKDPEPGKPGFTMETFVHRCGTPGCALGHYAVRTDLQSEFEIHKGTLYFNESDYPLYHGARHFGFDPDEETPCNYMMELFASDGCGRAKTRYEAAGYIRDFIRRHGGAA